MQQILNLDIAFRREIIPRIMKRGQKITKVIPKNRGRHKFIETNTGKKYYLMYKRGFFGTYSKQFKEERSLGESINVDCLYYCIDKKVDLIIIAYDEGKIYCITPKEWLDYANNHQTFRKVNKKDYKRNYGETEQITETTASIDIRKLRRWE